MHEPATRRLRGLALPGCVCACLAHSRHPTTPSTAPSGRHYVVGSPLNSASTLHLDISLAVSPTVPAPYPHQAETSLVAALDQPGASVILASAAPTDRRILPCAVPCLQPACISAPVARHCLAVAVSHSAQQTHLTLPSEPYVQLTYTNPSTRSASCTIRSRTNPPPTSTPKGRTISNSQWRSQQRLSSSRASRPRW